MKGGERKGDICRMFNLSRNTLNLWLKRQAETGDYQAITHFQQGYRHKITGWKRFEAFVQQHGGNATGDSPVVGRQRDAAEYQ